ncbi:MAG TPA: sugar ABC transporter permease [Dehalococcoidia bacterium]|nr:sugar ABC transporter permease [Dehalococcoidia bacterium]
MAIRASSSLDDATHRFAPPKKRRRSALAREEMRDGYIMILPWIIGFLLFTAGPMIFSLIMSFTEWGGLSAPRWIGLDNYRTLFSEKLIGIALYNTAFYTLLSVPLHVLGALLISLAMNMKLRGIRWYRTVYYLPAITPAVASTLLWILIFQPQFGVANWLLNLLHLPRQSWLLDPNLSKPTLIIMSLWSVGGGMPIFLAGLQGIPVELYEAAGIDGAKGWALTRYITLPLLTPIIFFSIITGVIGSFQVFTSAYLVSNGEGGPEYSTLFYVLYLYRNAFIYFKMGFASAMAWLLLLIILAFTVVQFRLGQRWVYYES